MTNLRRMVLFELQKKKIKLIMCLVDILFDSNVKHSTISNNFNNNINEN